MKAKLSKVLKAAAIAVFAFLIFFNINVLIDGNGFAVKMVNSIFAAEWWGDDPTGEAGGSGADYIRQDPSCLKETKLEYSWSPLPPFYTQTITFVWGTMTRCFANGNELCVPRPCS